MNPLSISEFERFDVDPARFDHEAHVAIAWNYLDHYAEKVATERFVAALRALTAHLGVPGKYHETITRFYLEVIAERRLTNSGADWKEFRSLNPDLLDPGLIARHYSPELIGSDEARNRYVPPDRLPLSSAA